MNFWNTFAALFSNFGALTWQMVVMWGIGALLIYLAIVKKMEPSLLLPIHPGRNLAVVLEVAARNFRQKQMGYNAAVELTRRHMERAQRMSEESEE